MKRYSVIKHYIKYTKKEALRLPKEILANAVAVEFSGGDSIEVDGIIEVVDGRLYLSSFQHGIVQWDEKKKCYMRHYHLTTKDIGQIVRVVVPDGDSP